MNEMRPKVGLGVCIIKDGKVLFGKRKKSHGPGTWAFPGGHLEMFESREACAQREVKEETGITIKNCRFGTVTNDIFPTEQKHYVTIIMIAEYAGGELTIMEPEKCEKRGWFAWDDLPQPFFVPLANLVASGFTPFG